MDRAGSQRLYPKETMLYRFRNRISQDIFRYQVRNIGHTDKLRTKDSRILIASMLRHDDILLYLLAVKSVYSKIGEAKIVILDDGSLTTKDCELLQDHIENASILPIWAVKNDKCPAGGCWERLAYIVDNVENYYVIQMDADTLTLGAIDEVVRNCRENRSFALGTRMGQNIVSLENAAALHDDSTTNQISVVGERAFSKFPNRQQFRYVRGSAGFAGFARGCFSRDRLEEFSTEMTTLLGSRWSEWGTEQIASNFVVANSPDAAVLPYPKYACYDPNVDASKCAFLHFIGTHRYQGGVYAKLAKEVISELS